jgi:hypothetical protein
MRIAVTLMGHPTTQVSPVSSLPTRLRPQESTWAHPALPSSREANMWRPWTTTDRIHG